MSLIKLNHFDSSKLFFLATEPDFYRTMKDDWLAINPDHVCSVTVAKHSSHGIVHHQGPDYTTHVFLPVRISLVNGEIHEVLESLDSVLALLAGETVNHYFNPGWTINRDEGKPDFNKLVRRRAA
jgi:hypothetical protein